MKTVANRERAQTWDRVADSGTAAGFGEPGLAGLVRAPDQPALADPPGSADSPGSADPPVSADPPGSADPPARRAWRQGRRGVSIRIAIAACAAFVIIGSVYPIGRMLYTALSGRGLQIVTDFVNSPARLQVLGNTVVLGVLVGVFGTAIGFLFAFVQTRLAVPFKRVLHVMALVPIVSPPFAVAFAAIVLFGRQGVIVEYDIYGLDGLVLVLSLSLFPVVYLILLGMMRALDPAIEESAMILGATHGQIFRTVILPLLAPGLASGFLLLFVEAIADLANPLAIGAGHPVLASEIYQAVIGNQDQVKAAAYSLILLVPSIGLYLGQRYLVGRKVRTTITGKPSGNVHLIRSWVRWPIFGVAVFLAAIIASLYATVIIGAVTVHFGGTDSGSHNLTFEHLHSVLFGLGQQAVTDTVVLAAMATPIAGLLGMVIAWLVVRHLRRASGWMDFAGTLGVAVPGTVLGIGYLLAYPSEVSIGPVVVLPPIQGENAIAAGAIVLLLAYVTRTVPSGLRSGTAALSQLDPHVEEASTSLGAGPFQTFRRVSLPLIRPALFSGLTYSFARSMTSLSTIILLTTSSWKIVTAQVADSVATSNYGVAFAYCTVLMAIVVVSFGLIRLLVGRSAALYRVAETTRRSK